MAGELQQKLTVVNGVSVTTTSQAIPLKGVRRATIFYTRASGTTGDSTITVTVSGDDSTYVAYSRLIDNTTTPATRVASKNVTTNTTVVLTIPLELDGDAFSSIKVTSTRNNSDDGVLTAKLVLEYFQ